ncbi:hypothetical protein EDD75_0380 [Thermodesulfitimonas autotrophica]|uniref:Uncharacterized protein n=1 Tax=Thermodesulfitimonas autotrophica TaxID=1894989 RepID=A0A3N5AXE7_9THEO|nr:hypothetical protein [Thermodesulfitimonas autotrophica]RPF49563.1 hypothetical protein EDD75_0380 [Thermodesulfitimonas autotrophica]
MQKAELRVVRVADIAEFPTELGNRCSLLPELGLNAYYNSEEELLEALTKSARKPGSLDICLRNSRCRRFYEAFREGRTPFSDKDPICLLEHGGRYWVVEGKHRVCLAMRAGVENLEAFVYHLKEDTESLLPHKGKPERFRFYLSFSLGSRGPEEVRGSVAYLWVQSPPGVIPGRFDFRGAWLDASQDTRGRWTELFPGLRYRVLANKELKKQGFFRRRERYFVESEVAVEPDHAKTKVWLTEVSAAEVLGPQLAGPPSFRTVYRFGCWRRGHLLRLSRTWPSLF